MKKQATIRNIFVLIFFMAFTGLSAQEQNNLTYRIVETGTVQDIQSYIDALNSSNMRFHRLKNTRNTIIFDTGVKVELYSASEIAASMPSFDPSAYPETFPAGKKQSLFSLGNNNFLLERYLEENIKKQ